MKYFWIGIVALIFLVLIVFWPTKQEAHYRTTPMTMSGEIFNAQIADTPALQELGLSYRTNIAQNDAMLFVFPVSGAYKFWMKDMNFPLDIIWLNSDKKIIYIEKNLSPNTYPASFGPDTESQFVVEVAPGTAERLGLKVGDEISFSCNGHFCAMPSENSTS